MEAIGLMAGGVAHDLNNMLTPILGFGELLLEKSNSDEERKEVVRLLTLALQIDGNATQHIDLVDGELKFSKNETKTQLNFDAVWKKYEEGKQLIQKAKEKEAKKKADAEYEKQIFGGKLSDYLIKERGLAPGKAMGDV